MDNILETGADIDIDELMARIRESAEKRKASLGPGERSGFRTQAPRSGSPLQLDHIMREIHHGGTFAESINQVPVKSKGGWKLKIERKFKSTLKWLIHWNTLPQAEFNRSVTRSLALMAQSLQTIHTNVIVAERRVRSETRDTATEIRRDLAGEMAELERKLSSRIDEQASGLSARLENIWKTAGIVIGKPGKPVPEPLSLGAVQAEPIPVGDQGVAEPAASSANDSGRVYLDLLKERKNVVVVGCGSGDVLGDVLDVLAHNGIKVTGVDSDPSVVKRCAELGFTVPCVKATEFLARAGDSSFDGVLIATAEKISATELQQMIRLLGSKLSSGGVAVVEGLNVYSPVAMAGYLNARADRNPTAADTVRFIFEQGPFRITSLRFSRPLPGTSHPLALDLVSGLTSEVAEYRTCGVIAVRS
ncbi:MAG TPA: class I SAM-dependent methyltransferase [Blastocatellia bacterium]|nr:class I SAM-dependent methyltransferase [Blastocatellia bacterium]